MESVSIIQRPMRGGLQVLRAVPGRQDRHDVDVRGIAHGRKNAPDWREKIFHATFALDDQVLTGADAPPGHYQKPQGFFVTLNVSDAVEADRLFETLAEKGAVQMPIQETFWAVRFGMLVDQFGMPWMINCGKPA